MRIIQTLWLPKTDEDPIKSKCGWLSPEYHWMSWILSFKSLQKYYSTIELYTNQAGKEVLIDKLKLPYSKVHLVFDDINIPESSWVYYKVYTYSLQNEPFIHIDGDVYISKAFPESFSTSAIVAQNREINFEFYQETLDIMNEKGFPIPAILKDKLPSTTYNAGIFGGNNLQIFKKYTEIVLDYIENNHELLKELDRSTCAMLLEQGIFSILIDKYNLKVACVFEEPFDDILYPGLGNLHEASEEKWYFHFMGITKSNRFYLKLLASKIKSEFPEEYYSTLRLCQEADIELDFKIYGLDDFSPSQKSSAYFKEIMRKFKHKAFQKDSIDWQYYYAKDAFVYRQAEYLYSLSENEIKALNILKNKDFQLIDTSKESVTTQNVLIMDTFGLTEISIDLEDLEMILLDAISETEPKTFDNILAEMSLYFDETDYQENVQALSKLLIEKIEIFIFRGLIRLI